MICKDFLIHNYIKTLQTTSRSHPSTHPSLLPGSYHSARLMCTVCPCLPSIPSQKQALAGVQKACSSNTRLSKS